MNLECLGWWGDFNNVRSFKVLCDIFDYFNSYFVWDAERLDRCSNHGSICNCKDCLECVNKMKQRIKQFNLSEEKVEWKGTDWFMETSIQEFLHRETELIRLLYYREINFQEFMEKRKRLIGGRLEWKKKHIG